MPNFEVQVVEFDTHGVEQITKSTHPSYDAIPPEIRDAFEAGSNLVMVYYGTTGIRTNRGPTS